VKPVSFPPVFYGEEALVSLSSWLQHKQPEGVAVLVDSNTKEACLDLFLESVEDLPPIEILEVDPGEDSKCMEVMAQLWQAMAELGLGRKSVLINLGGGMITDLGGLTAHLYMRGIDFVHVPTSLLGMVDAAHGGKVAVDVGGIKNLAGHFAWPEAVFIDPRFLETLPTLEWKSGWAEVIKHGLLAGGWLAQEVLSLKVPDASAIERAYAFKCEVVAADPLEEGLRAQLNAGHTLGHALESHLMQRQTPMPHGFAVAFGLLAESHLAVRKLGLDPGTVVRLTQVIASLYDFNGWVRPQTEDLLPWLQFDKKNRRGSVRMALIAALGKPQTNVAVSLDECRWALDHTFEQLEWKS
jgi:3-dehydroquinate synthase